MADTGWTIEETAIRLGGYAWVENRLYEVFGRLVATPGRVGVVALAHAAHSAWHAELWRSRIPILPHLSLGSVVVPPSPEVEAVLGLSDASSDASSDTSSDTGSAIRDDLIGIYRVVLPGLMDAYGKHLASATPVSDGPVIRALELVLADERRDSTEGQALLSSEWD